MVASATCGRPGGGRLHVAVSQLLGNHGKIAEDAEQAPPNETSGVNGRLRRHPILQR